jgi:hypothetical protein
MKYSSRALRFNLLAAALILPILATAQQSAIPAAATTESTVPRVISYSGTLTDLNGKPLTGVTGVTFFLFKDAQGGAPLWMETQNVHPDQAGHYTATLGSMTNQGLPSDVFASGEARWLSLQVHGQEEQPRVLLVAVPYALKAHDAETIGGLPPSAFMLAAPAAAGETSANTTALSSTALPAAAATITGTGTSGFLPDFTGAATIGNSAVFQSGASPNAKVGINTTAPAAALDVVGASTFRGLFTLPATANATASAGKNSQPMAVKASAFNSTSGAAVAQTFQWQAEPINNNSANAAATLNLLFGQGANAPAETGFKIGRAGIVTFAAGQTFPGSGTVKSVGLSAPTSDFVVSGSPVTSSGALTLNWNVVPTNAATANAIVKRDASGGFQSGRITATSTTDFGLVGISTSDPGVGGVSTSSFGVQGNSVSSLGVFGQSSSGFGIEGISDTNIGIVGVSATTAGIFGLSQGSQPTSSGFGPDGVVGESLSSVGTGVVAINTDPSGDALLAINQGSSGGPAALFVGSVTVAGNLSKSSGSFQIDHPLDPSHKYLYHSFVESPDMMNIYNGIITLDANGQAAVTLPDWFESLNQDFRYQLTAVGAPGPNLHVAQKIQNNAFKIAGGQPGMEVSWQVTGVRHDAWANAHRIPVEADKPASEQGSFIHPELFGAPVSQSVAAVRHPMVSNGAKLATGTGVSKNLVKP